MRMRGAAWVIGYFLEFICMSHGLHTHAPHDEAVHEAAHGGGLPVSHSLNQWVAIFTALIAALGAMVSYQGSNLMNEVLLYKNEAVLKKTKATDEWNYYQAVSTKAHLMALAVDLTTPDRVAGLKMKLRNIKLRKLRLSSVLMRWRKNPRRRMPNHSI
ncbi:MAG: DUF4337 family protein [Halothiobacillus sp.]